MAVGVLRVAATARPIGRPSLKDVSRPSTGDLIAGVSVALVAVPQSLAYAELAGLPPQYGLYATALPSLLAALFVSSRYLQTGPVALTALLTYGALSAHAVPGEGGYIEKAALLALLVGVMRLLLGIARMGRIAYLLSEPVVTGFTAGAVVVIVASQLPKIFDVDPEGEVLAAAASALGNPGEWQWPAVAFAAGTAALVVAGRYVHRLFPGVLAAVIVGVVVADAGGYTGSKVGELPGGFIPFRFGFPWSEASGLLLPAAVIALVGFAEPASIARTFAAAERLPWNASREMISQGVANLAAGVSGAFPVGGSFSRSSLNRMAGATSAWSGAVTGAFVLAVLPLLPLIEDLPRAVLGAVVIVAVVRLVDVREMARLPRGSFPQAMVGAGTTLATIALAPRVERGVLVGIGLAVAVHLYREMQVTAPGERDGNTLIVRPKGVMWFATVPQVERVVREELARHHDLASVVVDLGGVGRLDYSGAVSLRRILERLEAGGVTASVEGVPPSASRAVLAELDYYGSP